MPLTKATTNLINYQTPLISSNQLVKFYLTTPASFTATNKPMFLGSGTVGGKNWYESRGVGPNNYNYTISYNGTRWSLRKEDSEAEETVLANVGNESEPWLATWPVGNTFNLGNLERIDVLGNNIIIRSAISGIYYNEVFVGNNSTTTAPNQLQLGNSEITSFAYGAVQNRSDERDKTEIKNTELGLDFVKALRPVDFKWDMREDYRPEPPVAPSENATEEEKAAYEAAKLKWLEDVKLANINSDGSKKRNRFHHGLIAQEVKTVLDAKGIDFGGFQDHKIAGGDDVLSIGYAELIAPMIKAIQELSAEVTSLKAQLNP